MRIAIFLLFALIMICTSSYGREAGRHTFRYFSVNLPYGWTGDEQTGFVGDDPATWMLTLAKKEGDSFLAQISIYFLPNKPGVNSEEAASRLAEAQANTTAPAPQGNFMVFEGEPRTRVVKGRARTMVCATPAHLLIIIAQEPQQLEAGQIIESMKGETDEARAMLGR